LDGQKSQLKERIGQLKHEIDGLISQTRAKDQEILLMREELLRVEAMRKRDLIPVQRLLSTQRDLTRLEGERGVLTAQIAKAHGGISETELQMFGLDQTTQSEANKELREIEARIAELSERLTAADDLLRRIELRAPKSGIVHELNVHTVGGVIGPGETVMSIVPENDEFVVEVKIAPHDIDQVAIGQPVTLRFSAYNQATTPELKGFVAQRAVEITKDRHSGNAYYLARVGIDDRERATAAKLRLVAGMPVEGFIETSERTALSFLMKPVTDQFNRAFREN
jgi:HlyD family secretion protein